MSTELINEMYEGHVFDAMLLEADMASFHGPFDDLRGDGATEAILRDAVARSTLRKIRELPVKVSARMPLRRSSRSAQPR